jgi:cation transport protein ChaC
MPNIDLRLSAELVARAHRVVPDTGLPEGVVRCTDADHDDQVRGILADHAPAEDAWLFAYGSLLWNPAVTHVEETLALARGWHRCFRMRISSWRGTPERPGLMMALDRGGQCRGVALRLKRATLEEELHKLVRREMPVRHPGRPYMNLPRWIPVQTEAGTRRALAFVVNRAGANYAGTLPLDQTAEVLAAACGHGGSCAEYLHRTVEQLEARGIRDRTLWRLQAMVAARLAGSETTAQAATL